MSKLSNFRHRLKTLMQQEGITTEELAQRVNRTERTVTRWLGEASPPKTDAIVAICEAFPHWSQEYLIADRGPCMHEEQVIEPMDDTKTLTTILYWINVKNRTGKSLEALPREAHQHLWKVAKEDLQQLLEELEQWIDTNERLSLSKSFTILS